jgi:NDP-sugar pyrophosphorylase family protein
VRLSNCVILNRVHIKNYALVADSIIGWSSKSELLCFPPPLA